MFSMRSIVSEMVPVTVPDRSLRKAYWRHRFAGPPPHPSTPYSVSMRELTRRRDSSIGATRHTLLVYNTYLLRAEIYILDFLLDRVKDAAEEIADDAIPDWIPGSGYLEDAVSWAVDKGTGILKPILPDGKVVLEKKPALSARASEIGQELASGNVADIAALCEVWKTDLFEKLMTPLSAKYSAGLSVVSGSMANDDSLTGSGLCVLGLNRSVTKIAEHIFTNKGSRHQDADAWAQKSVILSRIDVGCGKIDLYSTHLHSGNDLGDVQNLNVDLGSLDLGVTEIDFGKIGLTSAPSEQDKHNVRIAQCEEIVEFIKQTHDPKNIAILVGDFNINAQDQAQHTQLRDVMFKAGLQDLWKRQYNDTSLGMTHGDPNQICPVNTPADEFANETLPAQGGSRIDYVFVELVKKTHSFDLDLTVIKRRPFRRAVATEGEAFMSDHIGLSMDLLCSPKK
ncbi:MAG: hypothetical protein JST84_24265 [Acidobacteria bacterium]|nr:hypothetical protein [Acidobacteriota bacterium]